MIIIKVHALNKKNNIMDRNYFLKLDEDLKSEIADGIKLDENGIFGPIMYQISFHSCLILGMRCVAYRNQLLEPYRGERIKYFDCIESILGIIYSDFPKIPFEEKLKLFHNRSFTPRTSRERFEAIQKIKDLRPKLETSWVEKC